MVVELLERLRSREMDVGLLTLFEPPAKTRAASSFPILDAGRKTKSDRFFLPRLVQQIRHFAPDVVHTHTHAGKYWGRSPRWPPGSPASFTPSTTLAIFAIGR